MVQPGREDLKASQLAPVLVGHDIVRVVGAHPEQLKGTDQRHAVRGDPEGHGAEAAVAPAATSAKQTIDVLGEKRAHSALEVTSVAFVSTTSCSDRTRPR
jgi:hypothetical protein